MIKTIDITDDVMNRLKEISPFDASIELKKGIFENGIGNDEYNFIEVKLKIGLVSDVLDNLIKKQKNIINFYDERTIM